MEQELKELQKLREYSADLLHRLRLAGKYRTPKHLLSPEPEELKQKPKQVQSSVTPGGKKRVQRSPVRSNNKSKPVPSGFPQLRMEQAIQEDIVKKVYLVLLFYIQD